MEREVKGRTSDGGWLCSLWLQDPRHIIDAPSPVGPLCAWRWHSGTESSPRPTAPLRGTDRRDVGSCRSWQLCPEPGEGRGSCGGSRGLRAFHGEQRAERAGSYIPFQGKCYKNRVSGNSSALPRVSGGGQVISYRSASPGWDGLPQTLSGSWAEKASGEDGELAAELLGKGCVSKVSKPPWTFTGN